MTRYSLHDYNPTSKAREANMEIFLGAKNNLLVFTVCHLTVIIPVPDALPTVPEGQRIGAHERAIDGTDSDPIEEAGTDANLLGEGKSL